MVLKNTLYIIGIVEVREQDGSLSAERAVLRSFHFRSAKWDSFPLPDHPSAGDGSLLAVHNHELLLYGEQPCSLSDRQLPFSFAVGVALEIHPFVGLQA